MATALLRKKSTRTFDSFRGLNFISEVPGVRNIEDEIEDCYRLRAAEKSERCSQRFELGLPNENFGPVIIDINGKNLLN